MNFSQRIQRALIRWNIEDVMIVAGIRELTGSNNAILMLYILSNWRKEPPVMGGRYCLETEKASKWISYLILSQ